MILSVSPSLLIKIVHGAMCPEGLYLLTHRSFCDAVGMIQLGGPHSTARHPGPGIPIIMAALTTCLSATSKFCAHSACISPHHSACLSGCFSDTSINICMVLSVLNSLALLEEVWCGSSYSIWCMRTDVRGCH
jgi:hypothetical protein